MTALTSLAGVRDRKSTRLNSSHDQISYAVFCLKKKKKSTPFPSASRASRQCRSGSPNAAPSGGSTTPRPTLSPWRSALSTTTPVRTQHTTLLTSERLLALIDYIVLLPVVTTLPILPLIKCPT